MKATCLMRDAWSIMLVYVIMSYWLIAIWALMSWSKMTLWQKRGDAFVSGIGNKYVGIYLYWCIDWIYWRNKLSVWFQSEHHMVICPPERPFLHKCKLYLELSQSNMKLWMIHCGPVDAALSPKSHLERHQDGSFIKWVATR